MTICAHFRSGWVPGSVCVEHFKKLPTCFPKRSQHVALPPAPKESSCCSASSPTLGVGRSFSFKPLWWACPGGCECELSIMKTLGIWGEGKATVDAWGGLGRRGGKLVLCVCLLVFSWIFQAGSGLDESIQGSPVLQSCPIPWLPAVAAAVSPWRHTPVGRACSWRAPCHVPIPGGAWEPTQARGGQAHSQLINSLPGIYSRCLISQRRALVGSPSTPCDSVIYGLGHVPLLCPHYLVIYLYRCIFSTDCIWCQGDESGTGMSSRHQASRQLRGLGDQADRRPFLSRPWGRGEVLSLAGRGRERGSEHCGARKAFHAYSRGRLAVGLTARTLG